MACFTTEFVLHTDNASVWAIDSCQVGQDIWVVQRTSRTEVSMHKWNIDTAIWNTIDFKNREMIEVALDIGFRMCSSDNKLYLWTSYDGSGRLFSFDMTTYEWTPIGFPHILGPVGSESEMVVLNNDIYLKYGNHTIYITSLGSTERMRQRLPNGYNGQPNKFSLCGMDGIMYLVQILQNGCRNVAKYDRENQNLVIVKACNTPRSYLKHTGPGEKYQTSTYACNNKIYQRVQWKDRLIIDCFDIETMEFHTIFDTVHNGGNAIKMSGTDKHAYLIYRWDGAIAFRVIDLNPSLETISLIMAVDHTVENETDVNAMKKVLPYGLRKQFENIVTWKIEEWERLHCKRNAGFRPMRLFGTDYY